MSTKISSLPMYPIVKSPSLPSSPSPLVDKNPYRIGQLIKAIIPHANGKNTLSPRLRVVKIESGQIFAQLDHFLPSSPVITHIGNPSQFIPLQ